MAFALLCVVVIFKHHCTVIIGIIEEHVNYKVLCGIMLLFSQTDDAKLVDNVDVSGILSTI
eukprot:1709947-Ditylum_brightwellii.AAC.1